MRYILIVGPQLDFESDFGVDVKVLLIYFGVCVLNEGVCVNYNKHFGPSVVVDPSVVPELSTAALKRNLAAHAAYDSSISTEGSRQDMVERLKEFLEIRRANLVVWEVVNGN